ncbi:hypothetical protein J6590_010589 [Homalodisca vitripennis]|nr:hypothetical protein J6590_010589 [Homalodisca vitripennis]
MDAMLECKNKLMNILTFQVGQWIRPTDIKIYSRVRSPLHIRRNRERAPVSSCSGRMWRGKPVVRNSFFPTSFLAEPTCALTVGTVNNDFDREKLATTLIVNTCYHLSCEKDYLSNDRVFGVVRKSTWEKSIGQSFINLDRNKISATSCLTKIQKEKLSSWPWAAPALMPRTSKEQEYPMVGTHQKPIAPRDRDLSAAGSSQDRKLPNPKISENYLRLVRTEIS